MTKIFSKDDKIKNLLMPQKYLDKYHQEAINFETLNLAFSTNSFKRKYLSTLKRTCH